MTHMCKFNTTHILVCRGLYENMHFSLLSTSKLVPIRVCLLLRFNETYNDMKYDYMNK